MRSLLIQASTVEKAVEKAWNSAGMPTEYTIKILDFGEKGFLGITKRNAIVSIIYDPQKQTSISDSQKRRSEQKAKVESKKRTQQPVRQRAPRKPMQKQRPPRKELAKPKIQKAQPKPQTQPQQKKPVEERHFWTDIMINDVNTWLKGIMNSMGISASFQPKANKKVLTIAFQGTVMDKPEDERLLFSSLSYLLIQLTKKMHKKKCQGYQILLTSRHHNTNKEQSNKK